MGDERTVGFADFGEPGQTAVLWCDGGPGCRLGAAYVAPSAADNGIRLIVIADPIHARHTASIVPDTELRIVPGAGHFSIEDHIVPALVDLGHRAA